MKVLRVRMKARRVIRTVLRHTWLSPPILLSLTACATIERRLTVSDLRPPYRIVTGRLREGEAVGPWIVAGSQEEAAVTRWLQTHADGWHTSLTNYATDDSIEGHDFTLTFGKGIAVFLKNSGKHGGYSVFREGNRLATRIQPWRARQVRDPLSREEAGPGSPITYRGGFDLPPSCRGLAPQIGEADGVEVKHAEGGRAGGTGRRNPPNFLMRLAWMRNES